MLDIHRKLCYSGQQWHVYQMCATQCQNSGLEKIYFLTSSIKQAWLENYLPKFAQNIESIFERGQSKLFLISSPTPIFMTYLGQFEVWLPACYQCFC